MNSTTPKSTRQPFESDASDVLQHLRGAIAEALGGLPEQPAKAAELHRNLKLDMMLSWRLFKVSGSPSPLAAGPHVPSPANLRVFLARIEERGVQRSLVSEVAEAARRFEELVAVHAGDRATFDCMVTALVEGEEAAKLHLRHKRAAFRAQRHILGGQARTHMKCLLLRPSETPGKVDGARVEGFVDLRPFRSDARMVVSRALVHDDDGSPRSLDRHPIDPDGETEHGIAILRQFSSQPLPEFKAVGTSPGCVDCQLAGQGVGNLAAVTCFEGHVVYGAVPRYREAGNLCCENRVAVRIPSEVLILDLLVHRDMCETLDPTALVIATHMGEPRTCDSPKDSDRLRFDETLTCLGTGPSVLHTPSVPRYAQLGRYVFDRLGWDGNMFNVYRCCIEYPVVPSLAMIRFDLPDAPKACP